MKIESVKISHYAACAYILFTLYYIVGSSCRFVHCLGQCEGPGRLVRDKTRGTVQLSPRRSSGAAGDPH